MTDKESTLMIEVRHRPQLSERTRLLSYTIVVSYRIHSFLVSQNKGRLQELMYPKQLKFIRPLNLHCTDPVKFLRRQKN